METILESEKLYVQRKITWNYFFLSNYGGYWKINRKAAELTSLSGFIGTSIVYWTGIN